MQADTPVVIVGAGPVWVRAAVELRQALPQAPIVLYGDKPWQPYPRRADPGHRLACARAGNPRHRSGRGVHISRPGRQPAMWAARLAKGRDALVHSALNGFTGPAGEEMLPRGGRPELTGAEVQAAVDFMISTVNLERNAP